MGEVVMGEEEKQFGKTLRRFSFSALLLSALPPRTEKIRSRRPPG